MTSAVPTNCPTPTGAAFFRTEAHPMVRLLGRNSWNGTRRAWISVMSLLALALVPFQPLAGSATGSTGKEAGTGLATGLAAEKTTFSGVLMDKACSAENKITEKALKHGKDCALMADCVKSGYGVLTAEGKFIAFDAAGNKKVAAFLKSFKRDDSIKIKVEGTLENSTLKVNTIKAE